MGETIKTVVVGGGQAGLSISYYLRQRGQEHIVLDAAEKPADSWRNHRWDSFTLVTPNWSFLLPGGEYDGEDPDGFMGRDEIVRRFEQYIEKQQLPIQHNMCVTSIQPDETTGGYIVETQQKEIRARNVVVANGWFREGKIPVYASRISPSILQIHSSEYRNPQSLPDGAVLVVGCAQSGAQIVEELYQSGRKVYLATGGAPRAPRRYRGKDFFRWIADSGFINRTPEMLRSPQEKNFIAPMLSGKNGGHTLNLHQFYRDGVVLMGHARDFVDGKMVLAPDLKENLGKSDQGEAFMLKGIEEYIRAKGIDAPEDQLPALKDAYQAPEVTSLDLEAEGIRTIIWACGFNYDPTLVRLPVIDHDGFPITKKGVTEFPGLYFLGLPWISKLKSAFIFGVAEDAAYLAGVIEQRDGSTRSL